MKERIIVGSLVTLLVLAVVVAAHFTDAIFITVSVAFFAICIAYAEWCERL